MSRNSEARETVERDLDGEIVPPFFLSGGGAGGCGADDIGLSSPDLWLPLLVLLPGVVGDAGEQVEAGCTSRESET